MNEFPTYLDIKLANTSKIFESEQIIGLSLEEIKKGEELYYKLLESLKNNKEIDEGLLGGLIGGGIGLLAGPAIMKAISKILGIDHGPLYDLLNSKLVLTALGIHLGSKF